MASGQSEGLKVVWELKYNLAEEGFADELLNLSN